MRAMTGSWLFVKWAGIAVLLFYVVLILVAIVRYRAKLSRMRSALWVPIVVGNFISLSVPWIFESVVVTRVCFVIAQLIYVAGIVILVRALAQSDQKVLLRADS